MKSEKEIGNVGKALSFKMGDIVTGGDPGNQD